MVTSGEVPTAPRSKFTFNRSIIARWASKEENLVLLGSPLRYDTCKWRMQLIKYFIGTAQPQMRARLRLSPLACSPQPPKTRKSGGRKGHCNMQYNKYINWRPTFKELFANGHHARVTQAMLLAEFLSWVHKIQIDAPPKRVYINLHFIH